jgi:CheY-like chemotaxis protein
MVPREVEVDVAFALERLPAVVGVYALSPLLSAELAAHPDAVIFAVALRPYTITNLVEAQYAVLAVTSYDTCGRMLYVNAEGALPTPMRRARLIKMGDVERKGAPARAAERAVDAQRLRRLEEAAGQRAAMAAELQRVLTNLDAPIAVSFQSGIFEVVPDPFPSPFVIPPRILVADDDATTVTSLRTLESVDIVHVTDGWSALEQLVEGDFDIALCAVVLGDWSGAKLYKMVAKQRPKMAARIVFLAARAAVAEAPPSTSLGRVLSRPVDPSAVQRLLDQWRAGH